MYAGGFIYLKGITLGVRAFAEFVRLGGDARFTLVGKGPEEIRARKLAQELKVDHLIDWVAWVDQPDLWRIYDAHDIFLFPSLHDSGGTVVVEALSHGLPVACFDLGGPGQIVTSASGIVQSTAGLTAHEAAVALGRALKQLVDDEPLFRRLSAGARLRAEEFTWSYRVAEALRKVAGRVQGREGLSKLQFAAFGRAALPEAGGGHGVGQ
jgi:glycosyltransferase involved in cell wall biosynthesis